MVNMENAEEVMQILDRFTRLKQKEIPKELDDYLQYVAKTGDTVFKWSSLKYLFREKLLNVIKHFHDTSPRVDEIPQYPNVDPFNYESMKSSLLERLELFNAAPFTIQRLCELLIDPRKQYSRIDKFMRALEKNILVVSTIEPGRKRTESENGDSLDSVVNGDLSLDVNVDIDMENEPLFNMEAQNGNGNGAVAAADVAAAAEADAAAEAEAETVDVKEKEKEKEKPAVIAEVSNAKHATTDDDILPNPKKAKLDLDEKEEKETEKEKEKEKDKELDAVETVPQPAGKTETDAEKKSATSKDDVDQETEADKKVLDDAEMVDDDNKPVVLKEVQEKNETLKEQEELEAKEKEKEKEKENVEAEPKDKENEKADVDQEKKVSTDEKVSPAKQGDTEAERANADADAAVPAAVEKAELEEQEKVIEKQEIEKGEKEEKKEPAAAADVAETDAKPANVAEKKVEQKDAVKEVVGDHVDNKPHVEEVVKASELSEISKDVNAEKETSIPKEAAAFIAASIAKIETESVDAVPEAKVEATKIAPESDAANAASTKTQVEKTENGNDGQVAPLAADDKAVDAKTATTTNAEAPSAEATPAIEKSDDAETANAPRDEPPPVAEVVAEVQPAITAAENNTAAVSETAAVSVTATPALALNDQPMDDVPLDEALPAIDEVVMAESGGATAMATDAIEPAKDEPAGMEVDDTSQEAMDQ